MERLKKKERFKLKRLKRRAERELEFGPERLVTGIDCQSNTITYELECGHAILATKFPTLKRILWVNRELCIFPPTLRCRCIECKEEQHAKAATP